MLSDHHAGPSRSAPPALTFGDVLHDAGLVSEDVLVIRHVYKPDGIPTPADITPDTVHAYTREQLITSRRISAAPPRWWVVFLAEPHARARLYTVYENHGETRAERTATCRYFDLRPASVLTSLRDRLVVDWAASPINWAVRGATAEGFDVVDI